MKHGNAFSLHPVPATSSCHTHLLPLPQICHASSCLCTGYPLLYKGLLLVNHHITAEAHSSHFLPGLQEFQSLIASQYLSAPVFMTLLGFYPVMSLLGGLPSLLSKDRHRGCLCLDLDVQHAVTSFPEYLHIAVKPCSPPSSPGLRIREGSTDSSFAGEGAYARSHTLMAPDLEFPRTKAHHWRSGTRHLPQAATQAALQVCSLQSQQPTPGLTPFSEHTPPSFSSNWAR